MNPAKIEHPGTGGGLRYLTEDAAPNMVNQEQSHSCQAACARQLLKDAGVETSEADLLAKIGYYEGIGTLSKPTAAVLTKVHPALNFSGGEIQEDAPAVSCSEGPWIANLRTEHGTVHSVIVDCIEGDIVYVRDPWGLEGPGSGMGTIATLRAEDFFGHWQWTFYSGVIPVERKGGK